MLTINGRFFGETQGSIGNVGFDDANNGNSFPYIYLDNSDIKSWSDGKIELKLPSIINDPAKEYPTPGSGIIEVLNQYNVGGESKNAIDIEYSINTRVSGNKNRSVLSNQNNGGYKISIYKDLAYNSDAMRCIKAALKSWSCATGINWTIGNIVNTPDFPNDNSSIITIGSLKAQAVMSTEVRLSASCPVGGPTNMTRFKITVNENDHDFFYKPETDAALPSQTTEDFYTAILHELGHAHLLMHKNNPNEVMYYKNPSPGDPRKATTLQTYDIAGANEVMNYSQSNTPSCATVMLKKYPNGCNSTTNDFTLRGINITTRCAPGLSSNGVLPQLLPQTIGGIAPFTYIWEALPNNETTLDDYSSDMPKIISSSGTNYARYKLTVIDNSDVPKAASWEINVKLKTTQTYDYAIRDSYEDIYDEPNMQKDWRWANSPDIWNRQIQDGSLEHENPEYFNTNPNYLYIRIKNIGCIAPPQDIHYMRLYWTKASTGEKWDADWKTATFNGQPAGLEITNGGDGIKISPTLQPGEERIVISEWFPPKPELYDAAIKQVDVCVLARIETGTPPISYPFGLTTPEVYEPTANTLALNVLGNNEIITRNLIVTNFNPNNRVAGHHNIILANPNALSSEVFNIRFDYDFSAASHTFAEMGNVVLDLGREVYQRWVLSGSMGEGLQMIPGTTSVLVTDPYHLVIKNITLNPSEKQLISVLFTSKLGVSVLEKEVFYFTISQWNVQTNQSTGDVHFEVGFLDQKVSNRIARNSAISQLNSIVTTDFASIYPNPANEEIYIETYAESENDIDITICDMTGREVMESLHEKASGPYLKTVNLSQLQSGIYLFTIRMNGKTTIKKVVKN